MFSRYCITKHVTFSSRVGIMLDAWMHPLDKTICDRVQQPVLLVNYEKFQWKLNVEQQVQWMQKDNVDRRLITIKSVFTYWLMLVGFVAGSRSTSRREFKYLQSKCCWYEIYEFILFSECKKQF